MNNFKKGVIQEAETYGGRANMLMEAFTGKIDWRDQVAYVNDIQKITKKDIVDFANIAFTIR